MKVAEHKPASISQVQKKSETPFFDHESEQAQPFFAGKEAVGSEAFFSPSSPLSNGSLIQAKLTVGQPNDVYEQEADSVADKVVQRLAKTDTAAPPLSANRTITQGGTVSEGATPIIQHKTNAPEEEKLDRKEESKEELPELQKSPVSAVGDDEGLQMKCAACEGEEHDHIQKKGNNTEGVASSNIETQLNSSKGGGSPLPDNTRTSMESAMGADFSTVRVHTGSNAVQMSQDLNAQAFTHGSDVYFNEGKYNPSGTEGSKLLAHELTHTVQQRNCANIVQKQSSIQSSLTPAYARSLSETELRQQVLTARRSLNEADSSNNFTNTIQNNLIILESEFSNRSLLKLEQQSTPYIQVSSPILNDYRTSIESLVSLGREPLNEPEGILIPANQVIGVDEFGSLQFIDANSFSRIDSNLISILDNVAESVNSGIPPTSSYSGGSRQILLWEDGRAVFTPQMSGSLASLLNRGTPAEYNNPTLITHLDTPWQRVKDSVIHGSFTSGLYQLGSHPISRFNGINLPPGSRIRFADVGRLLAGQMETRLVTISNGNKFFAWDAHMPVSGSKGTAATAPLWHVNQKGMANVFGQTDHSAMTASQISQARGLKYLRVGGRIFFVVGVVVDGYHLLQSADQSFERGTPRPLIAQTIRTIGSWAGGWAGAKAGCAAGAVAGIETGPGLVLTCMAGGIIGGFAGYFSADWIADMISEN
jgi:Domain of unknown function (DUF4157)